MAVGRLSSASTLLSGTPLQGKASLKYALASGVNAAPIISQKFATEARALVDSIGFNSAGTLHIPAGGVREPASILCGKGTYLGKPHKLTVPTYVGRSASVRQAATGSRTGSL